MEVFGDLDWGKALIGVALFAPGFIIYFFRCNFVTGRRGKTSDVVLELCLLSCVYYTFVGPIALSVDADSWVVGILVFFIVPLIIGVTLGMATQRGWFEKLYYILKMNPIHPAETGWDFAFGTLREETWVIVRLRDHRKVFGLFKRSSGASTNLLHRDIYISDVRKDDFSKFENDGRERGMWIHEDQIIEIEFIKN